MLIDILPKEFKITCTLRFYSYKRNKDFDVIYSICIYKSHSQRFQFHNSYSDNGPITLFVYSKVAREVIHDEPRHSYRLAGKAQEETQKVLQTVKPREIHLEIVRKMNKELARDGNLQNLKLLKVSESEIGTKLQV